MDQYSNTILEIPYFEVTRDVTRTAIRRGKDLIMVETIHGKVTTPLPEVCPFCGKPIHFNQYLQVYLKHLTVLHTHIRLEVTYKQGLCHRCHRTVTQEIPFKEPDHLITTTFACMTLGLLDYSDLTVSTVARIMHTNRKLIRELDKRRLEDRYGEMKPAHYSRYVCVDEFSLHKELQ